MTRLNSLPYFYQSTVGFDRLLDELSQSIDSKNNGYPPYNIIELNDQEWKIDIAVAGFNQDNINISLDKSVLTIEGENPKLDENIKFVHKGIAHRNFKRQFTLAEYVEVDNAVIDSGILSIHLVKRVPEQLKAKKIEIKSFN